MSETADLTVDDQPQTVVEQIEAECEAHATVELNSKRRSRQISTLVR